MTRNTKNSSNKKDESTKNQKNINFLNMVYKDIKNPSEYEVNNISKSIRMSPSDVKKWFKMKRDSEICGKNLKYSEKVIRSGEKNPGSIDFLFCKVKRVPRCTTAVDAELSGYFKTKYISNYNKLKKIFENDILEKYRYISDSFFYAYNGSLKKYEDKEYFKHVERLNRRDVRRN